MGQIIVMWALSQSFPFSNQDFEVPALPLDLLLKVVLELAPHLHLSMLFTEFVQINADSVTTAFC